MKRVFLDLEGTLIDDWDTLNFLPENAEKIQEFIKSNSIKLIEIFSFAIFNKADEQRFNEVLKPHLEKFFNCEVFVWTKEEIMKIVLGGCNRGMTEFEFSWIFGKQLSFIEFCRRTWKAGEYILFDDTVRNSVFIEGDLTIRTVKI